MIAHSMQTDDRVIGFSWSVIPDPKPTARGFLEPVARRIILPFNIDLPSSSRRRSTGCSFDPFAIDDKGESIGVSRYATRDASLTRAPSRKRLRWV